MHTRAHTAALTRPIAAALTSVVALALVVAVLVRSVWDWDRTLLLISEDELVIQRRGMRRSESIVPLRAIHRLRVRRSLLGRVFGYGTIELTGPAKGSRLRFVPRPDEVSAVISAYAGRHDVR